MKQFDEDQAYEQWRQAKIERNWDNLPTYLKQSTQIHQKVGTVIPFSRTADRDPNPRIPLSVPVDGTNKPNLWVTVACIVLAILLLVATVTYSTPASAQTTVCTPDGRGGFVCRPYPQCAPGTVC